MLNQLYIKNFTIIDCLDICLKPGFSVITGETGAGKSIILGAINLLIGQRADIKSIKSGSDKCVIEAHFNINKYKLRDFFEENNIEYDAEDCIMRREITINGKSRAFINDTPVPLNLMKILGQQLIDIHSQHQNMMLSDKNFQISVTDLIADNRKEKEDYCDLYHQYVEAQKEVRELSAEIERNRTNEDFMRFQHNELCEAKLTPGMQENLEQESQMLNNIETIKSALFTADNCLSGNDNNGVISLLRDANRNISSISNLCKGLEDISERLDSCYIEIKDIAQEISAKAEDTDYDPHRLEIIEETLDKIYSLQKKHHADTVDELICIREDISRKLSLMDNSDDELKALTEKEAMLLEECKEKARILTATRQKAARKIEQDMKEMLVPLGIPNVKFAIDIQDKPLSDDGADSISFMFSANKNTPMLPVSQVASGGEIARLMLSLKALIGKTVMLPTIIFDEIDTGVSGKIAEQMAEMMMEMGNNDKQVISITHLPQIAARGKTHYKVYKEDTPEETVSRMVMLNDDERVSEIAQMLSGADITEAAISNAKELLKA
ncbi:MAG: DNA repair protein RecN [Prevotella sp.]|nr:DNA repair protein RecN [Prevotella sp.]